MPFRIHFIFSLISLTVIPIFVLFQSSSPSNFSGVGATEAASILHSPSYSSTNLRVMTNGDLPATVKSILTQVHEFPSCIETNVLLMHDESGEVSLGPR